MLRNLKDKVWPLVDAGEVKPVVHETFALTEAAAAASPDGIERAHRQDRAHHMSAGAGRGAILFALGWRLYSGYATRTLRSLPPKGAAPEPRGAGPGRGA